MAREVTRFAAALRKALAGEALPTPFPDAFLRARRYHSAWARQDVPKQASHVDDTLAKLHGEVMAVRARQAQEGVPPAPPEDLLAQLRLLGGQEAEAAARQQFDQSWQAVSRDDLAARVREVAERAFWDAIKEQTLSGDYSGLFGVLRELGKAMGALLAHSASAQEDLEDKFDAGWLEQQAANGCLSSEQVRELISHLTKTISSWQAPIDDADTAAWGGAVGEMLKRTEGMPLAPFVAEFLLPFLRGAIDRVGKVYTRLLELMPSQEREALAAAAAAAAAGPSAGISGEAPTDPMGEQD